MARRSSRRVARSAKTGRFVKKSTAARHPRTTVLDTVGGSKRGKPVKVARSAITGRFVKKSTAKRNPSTTVIEKVRK